MNVKALAAIVGTLSLGALATGCASSKAAENQQSGTTEAASKGGEASCNAKATDAKGSDAACKASATEAKPAEGACGEGSCGGKK
jgi:uncharacterized low-complexity protein